MDDSLLRPNGLERLQGMLNLTNVAGGLSVRSRCYNLVSFDGTGEATDARGRLPRITTGVMAPRDGRLKPGEIERIPWIDSAEDNRAITEVHTQQMQDCGMEVVNAHTFPRHGLNERLTDQFPARVVFEIIA